MARGGHRSRGQDSTSGTFQASTSASTLAPGPPYNRHFSVPIPVIDTQFHKALKKAIQQQKSHTKKQKIALAEAEAIEKERFHVAQKEKLEILEIELQKDEERAQKSKSELDIATAKMDEASNRLQRLLRKKEEIEEKERHRMDQKKQEMEQELEQKLEEEKKLDMERKRCAEKLESLRAKRQKEEETLAKLIQEEKEYNEQRKLDPKILQPHKFTESEKACVKRKRKRNNDDENKDENDKNSLSKVTSATSLSSTDKNLTDQSIKESSTKKLNQKYNLKENQSFNSLAESKEGQPEQKAQNYDNSPMSTSKEKDAAVDKNSDATISESLTIKESEKKAITMKKIQEQLDGLNQTKSQMIWLLKQVIQGENKQKDAEKKRNELQQGENK